MSYLHTFDFRGTTFKRTFAGRNYPFAVVVEATEEGRAAIVADLETEIAGERKKIAELVPATKSPEARVTYELASAAIRWWTAVVPGRYGTDVELWLNVEERGSREVLASTDPVCREAVKVGFMPTRIRSRGGSFNSQRGLFGGLDVYHSVESDLLDTPQGAIDAAEKRIVGLLEQIIRTKLAPVEAKSAVCAGWCSRRDLANKLAAKSRSRFNRVTVISSISITEKGKAKSGK